jgi:hypothetical protein
MLDLGKLDVDEIATALSDQTDYEHRWLINPRTGEIAFWTSDTGMKGRTRSTSTSSICGRSTLSRRRFGMRTWLTSPRE